MVLRIQATVSELNGKIAVLVTDDRQQLSVPAVEISESLAVGDRCVVSIQPFSEAELERSELARTILNTLISDERTESRKTPEEG